MGAQILLRFVDWEAQLNSKGQLPGYVPIRIHKAGIETKGHMIDLKGLKTLEHICCLRHSIVLDFKPQVIDLTELITASTEGRNWFDSLQAQWGKYEGAIPMTFSLEFPDFNPLRYTQYPPDSIERMTDHTHYWQPPRGILRRLPKGTYLCKILPPMKWPSGKWLPNVYYKRKVVRADNEEEEYSICDAQENFGRPPGVLLGKLSESDIEEKTIPFEGGFPRVHYLELVYSVALRNAHKDCAHGIQVFLSE